MNLNCNALLYPVKCENDLMRYVSYEEKNVTDKKLSFVLYSYIYS